VPYAAYVSAAYRNLWLAPALVALLCFASPHAAAQDESDPITLLRPPLIKLAEAARPENRFTYLDLNHTVNLSERGAKLSDTTQLFEVMYIGNQQFSRLLQKDGKKLHGSELAAEQKRYDDAVREYDALNDTARSRLFYTQLGTLGVNLTVSSLASQYRNTVAGAALLPFCSCVMIDSMPLAGAPQRKFRMWIDPAKGQILRLDSTLLADIGQDMAGGTLTVLWTYIDDIPLITKSHVDVNVSYSGKRVRVISDHTYSEYKRVTVEEKH
jgi:hypothetical protein